MPKERLEVFSVGKIITMTDYKELSVNASLEMSSRQDKGLKDILNAFAVGIRTGIWPIHIQDLLRTSEVAFEIEEKL